MTSQIGPNSENLEQITEGTETLALKRLVQSRTFCSPEELEYAAGKAFAGLFGVKKSFWGSQSKFIKAEEIAQILVASNLAAGIEHGLKLLEPYLRLSPYHELINIGYSDVVSFSIVKDKRRGLGYKLVYHDVSPGDR